MTDVRQQEKNTKIVVVLYKTVIEIKAIKTYLPMQPGDIKSTYADSLLLENWINFKPGTSIENGVKKFIDWYRSYY